MRHPAVQRWLGLGVGAAALAGLTASISYYAFAQAPDGPGRTVVAQRRPGGLDAQAQPGQPGEPRRPGAPPFGPGGPQFGPGGPMMGGPMMMGGASMTATSTAVYVMRGNTLYAFDANTLKLKARAELPDGPPGGFRPGGFRPMPPPGQPGDDQQQ